MFEHFAINGAGLGDYMFLHIRLIHSDCRQEMERCQDPWLAEIQEEFRHGSLTKDNWAFLHSEETAVPGSWLNGNASCGNAACQQLASAHRRTERRATVASEVNNQLGLQLDADDRVWERIAWSRDIDDAQRRARESGRPILFFSIWGKLDGRC